LPKNSSNPCRVVAPGAPALDSPVRSVAMPVMKAERPAVQLRSA
jgi:hypothetical protein